MKKKAKIKEEKIPRTKSAKQELAQQVLDLFGREKDKYLFLTVEIIKDVLNKEDDHIFWVLSYLGETDKIYCLNSYGTAVYLPRPNQLNYSAKELLNALSPKYFDGIGKSLKDALTEKPKINLDEDFLKTIAKEVKWPADFIGIVINAYVESGLISLNKGKISLPGRYRDSSLGYGNLKSVAISTTAADKSLELILKAKNNPFGSFSELDAMHNEYQKKSAIKTIGITTSKPEVKIQNISEILFGHQDLDLEVLEKVMAVLEGQAPAERPDVLVVDGLIFGDYKFQKKRLRNVLSIPTESQQISAAHLFLERCKDLNVKIIYNMGMEDFNICENRTVDALRIVDNLAPHSAKRSVNYYELDKLKQNENWDFHYHFEVDVVFEYQLRTGRGLYTAKDCQEKYGVEIEEYLMLLETYMALTRGEEIPDESYKRVIRIENIPLPNKVFTDFIVADNFILEATLANKKKVAIYNMHDFNLNSSTIKADPTRNLRNIFSQIASLGDDTSLPDVITINGQYQAFGMLKSRKDGQMLIMSTPGMQKAQIYRRGLNSGISIDPSWKKLTTRGEFFQAASTSFTETSLGSWKIDFLNKSFLDKMSISSDRVTVAILADWQTGSTTMRPDLQVKVLDYIAHELLPKGKVHIMFIGDIIQGQNYPGMSQENKHIGLLSVDDQQEFVRTFILNTFKSLPASSLRNIIGVDIVPGNHEWNSGHTWLGTSHSLYLKHVFEMIGLLKRVPIPVQLHTTPITTEGDFFRLFAGFTDVAGYGIMLQHIIVEKGAKGGGTGPAIYQIKALKDGLGDLLSGRDIMVSGHWHSPQYLLLGKLLAYITGCEADGSGYEFVRGYRPFIASSFFHLGGNKPPTLEIMTKQAQLAYKNKGFYSDKNLKDLGLLNDPDFKAEIHGSFNRKNPQSAIHKALWQIVDQLINGYTSRI